MFYIKQGSIPSKRHIQFRDKEGNLFFEEHISREGFSSIYSNVYHHSMPTETKEVGEFTSQDNVYSSGKHKNRHYFSRRLNQDGNAIDSRKLFFFNDDLSIYKICASKHMDFLYRNNYDKIA